MKDKVKQLWKTCFADSDAFIDLYFNKRYHENINLSIEEEKEIVAALQLIPYPMTFCNTIIATDYISGACTHPDYRNQGVMSRLLNQAISTMYDNNVLIGTLIPAEKWLFDYYRKFGYESIFYYSSLTETIPSFIESSTYSFQKNPTDLKELYSYFNQQMSKRSCCIQHTEEDFEIILEDLYLSEGFLYAAYKGNKIKGMAFCLPDEKSILVKELVTDSHLVRNELIQKIGNIFHKTVTINQPPFDSQSHPLGMGRVINAEKLVTIYAEAYPDLSVCFRLTDLFIPENEGFYELKDGKLTRSYYPIDSKDYPEITINQLTYLLLKGYNKEYPFSFKEMPVQKPYMSLMLD